MHLLMCACRSMFCVCSPCAYMCEPLHLCAACRSRDVLPAFTLQTWTVTKAHRATRLTSCRVQWEQVKKPQTGHVRQRVCLPQTVFVHFVWLQSSAWVSYLASGGGFFCVSLRNDGEEIVAVEKNTGTKKEEEEEEEESARRGDGHD